VALAVCLTLLSLSRGLKILLQIFSDTEKKREKLGTIDPSFSIQSIINWVNAAHVGITTSTGETLFMLL